MATLKQIEANRRNAQKSTGPRTPEGKAAVRLNSLSHGLRARTVVLPGENRQEFEQLCDDLEAEWQPRTRSEHFYVEQMAVSQWKLARMEVGEADIFSVPTKAEAQIPLLDRLWQAQCRLERAYARAQRDLERLQIARNRIEEARALQQAIREQQEKIDAARAPKPKPLAMVAPAVYNPPPRALHATRLACPAEPADRLPDSA